jgi:hypothetical protein
MPLADVIIWIANRGMTGTLKVTRDPIVKLIRIERGAAVRVDSNNPREALGQHLVNFGLVTEDQLTRAFKVQGETKVLLGRILVMIGIAREDQVVRTLEFLIRETILDALRWTTGEFAFSANDKDETRPDIEASVPLLEIHREGARRAGMWDQFWRVFASPLDSLHVNTERITQAVPPESFDGRILALAQLGLSIEAIALELHALDFHLYARLYDLYRMGIIEPREPSQDLGRVDARLPSPISIRMLTPAEVKLEEAVLLFRTPSEPPTPAGASTGDLVRQRGWIGEVTPIPAATAQVAWHAQKAMPEKPAAASPASWSTATPALLRPMDEVLKRRMTAGERYILTRIDGTRSIQSIMQVSPMSDREALEIFQRFARDGIIRVE